MWYGYLAVGRVRTPPVLVLLVLWGGRLWISLPWGGWTRPSTSSPLVPGRALSGTSRPSPSASPMSWSTLPRDRPTGIDTLRLVACFLTQVGWPRETVTSTHLFAICVTATPSRRRTRLSVLPRPTVERSLCRHALLLLAGVLVMFYQMLRLWDLAVVLLWMNNENYREEMSHGWCRDAYWTLSIDQFLFLHIWITRCQFALMNMFVCVMSGELACCDFELQTLLDSRFIVSVLVVLGPDCVCGRRFSCLVTVRLLDLWLG